MVEDVAIVGAWITSCLGARQAPDGRRISTNRLATAVSGVSRDLSGCWTEGLFSPGIGSAWFQGVVFPHRDCAFPWLDFCQSGAIRPSGDDPWMLTQSEYDTSCFTKGKY
jgi:hypothetical protein